MRKRVFLNLAASWLTPRRLRAQAGVLALCLWGVCAADFATPGFFDRAGNIKFQDFIQFPVAARVIAQGRAAQIYDEQVLTDGIRAIVGRETRVRIQYYYGPQVALPFVPLIRLPFLAQAGIWVALSLLMYFGSVYLLWKACAGLHPYRGLVTICAVAYPPLFHFFVRGQISAVALLCFTLSCLAFLARRDWLAGIALGCLVFKPQFLVAIPLILLLAQAWKVLAGLAISAGAQLTFALAYFGPAVMRRYIATLLLVARRPSAAELSLSPIQMHSLRAFWALLVPWPTGVWVLYILSSLGVIGLAAAAWRSSSPRALRFSALVLAAVLVNPHIYIYDLLVLAPVFLLLGDWILKHTQKHSRASLSVLLYLAFVLPLLGPLSRWTHVQLSVPVFTALLWVIWRCCSSAQSATGHYQLASTESRVV